MNSYPRPEDSLARKLRYMLDSIRKLFRDVSNLRHQVELLENRVTELEP